MTVLAAAIFLSRREAGWSEVQLTAAEQQAAQRTAGKQVIKDYVQKEFGYDLERTLCDLLRGQYAPDMQVVNPAMKAYARSSRKDVQKLLGYAKALGVETKVRNYLEVLL